MSDPYNALAIPPSALDKGGVEVLRAAIVEGGLHVTLRRAFNDPTAWGTLLADVARQVARVYAQEQTHSEDDVIARIRDSFGQELQGPGAPGSIAPIGS